MPSLSFPPGQAVGRLEWPGSGDGATPVLATGVVTVPDSAEITLDVMLIESVRQTDGPSGGYHSTLSIHTHDGPGEFVAEDSRGWEITGGREPAELRFLRDLPSDSITSLHLRAPIVPESLDCVTHLAPGLRRLYLARTGLTDDSLGAVGALRGLVYLQSWGNRFTDLGVQQLASLTRLESLYLEEETLSAAAFRFAAALPHLRRLGLQDVPVSDVELAELRRRLPAVDVR